MQARLILADNYRSVLAAQRMKDSLERINAAALLLLAEHEDDARAESRLPRAQVRRRARHAGGNTSPRRARRP